MRLNVDGRLVAYFFCFLFSRVNKGVPDDFVLRLKMRLENSFSVAKSHSTFAPEIKFATGLPTRTIINLNIKQKWQRETKKR